MAEFISEKQDLTHLEWSRTWRPAVIAGSFLKAASEFGAKKTYYKLSNYDSINGVTGHESVNELIVDRLLTVLGVEHLSYRLIHADVTVNGRSLRLTFAPRRTSRRGAVTGTKYSAICTACWMNRFSIRSGT